MLERASECEWRATFFPLWESLAALAELLQHWGINTNALNLRSLKTVRSRLILSFRLINSCMPSAYALAFKGKTSAEVFELRGELWLFLQDKSVVWRPAL